MSAWIDTPSGRQCTREGHNGATFARSEVCPFCVSDPGPAISIEVGGQSENIDRDLMAEAAADLGLAKFLHRVGREMIEDGTAQDRSVAAKLIAEGTKLKRSVFETKDKVSGREHSRYLVEHEKEVRGHRRGRN